AKVSRARTDMRTIAVAEEAYRIDWNTYTHCNRAEDNPYAYYSATSRGWGGFAQLTTPVAYLSTIPLSPFGQSRVAGNEAQWRPAQAYRLGTGNSNSKQSTGKPWTSNPEGFPADTFILDCDGPDNMEDSTAGYGTGAWPWPTVNPNSPQTVGEVLARVYDPTNGAVSGGDLYRLGGAKPPGLAYDVLWAATSK
ncbi:hypothetical protein FJY63_03740, partial [Candidatus Sumerlaeota bacterium]|nr:hypothetical protein [Candidatus Sumerlaeota bacterium]